MNIELASVIPRFVNKFICCHLDRNKVRPLLSDCYIQTLAEAWQTTVVVGRYILRSLEWTNLEGERGWGC